MQEGKWLPGKSSLPEGIVELCFSHIVIAKLQGTKSQHNVHLMLMGGERFGIFHTAKKTYIKLPFFFHKKTVD